MGLLKGIDPLLTADVLHVLRSMGHGNKLVVCDCNFPAGARLPPSPCVLHFSFSRCSGRCSQLSHVLSGRRARASRNRHAHDDGEAHRPDRAPPRGAGRDLQPPAAGLLRGGAGDVHGAAGGCGSSARGGRGGFGPEGRDRAALRIRYEGLPDRAILVLRGGEGLLRGYTDHGEATVRERHPSEGMRRSRWE